MSLTQNLKQTWFRAIAFLLVIVLPVTEIGPYAEALGEAKGPTHASIVSDIAVPSELGTIEERFEGKGDRFVIHLQDAHGNLSAQHNLAKLINYFHKQYDTELLFLEGGAGKLPMKEARTFPNEEARKKASLQFLERFQLTGPEYYVVSENPDMDVYGLEQMKNYYANRTAYLEAQKAERELAPTLTRFLRIMKGWSKEFLNRELKMLLEESAHAKKDAAFLIRHLKRLRAGYADAGRAPAFKERFPALETLLENESTVPPVESLTILREYETLLQDAREARIVSPSERAILDILDRSETLRKLFSLELTPPEYTALKEKPVMYSAESFRSMFRELCRMNQWDPAFESLFAHIQIFTDFYEGARVRDHQMSGAARKFLRRRKNHRAVAVTGGFHTPGFTAELRRAGCSYIVVRPQIDTFHVNESTRYHRLAWYELSRALSTALIPELELIAGFGSGERYQSLLRAMRDEAGKLGTSASASGFGMYEGVDRMYVEAIADGRVRLRVRPTILEDMIFGARSLSDGEAEALANVLRANRKEDRALAIRAMEYIFKSGYYDDHIPGFLSYVLDGHYPELVSKALAYLQKYPQVKWHIRMDSQRRLFALMSSDHPQIAWQALKIILNALMTPSVPASEGGIESDLLFLHLHRALSDGIFGADELYNEFFGAFEYWLYAPMERVKKDWEGNTERPHRFLVSRLLADISRYRPKEKAPHLLLPEKTWSKINGILSEIEGDALWSRLTPGAQVRMKVWVVLSIVKEKILSKKEIHKKLRALAIEESAHSLEHYNHERPDEPVMMGVEIHTHTRLSSGQSAVSRARALAVLDLLLYLMDVPKNRSPAIISDPPTRPSLTIVPSFEVANPRSGTRASSLLEIQTLPAFAPSTHYDTLNDIRELVSLLTGGYDLFLGEDSSVKEAHLEQHISVSHAQPGQPDDRNRNREDALFVATGVAAFNAIDAFPTKNGQAVIVRPLVNHRFGFRARRTRSGGYRDEYADVSFYHAARDEQTQVLFDAVNLRAYHVLKALSVVTQTLSRKRTQKHYDKRGSWLRNAGLIWMSAFRRIPTTPELSMYRLMNEYVERAAEKTNAHPPYAQKFGRLRGATWGAVAAYDRAVEAGKSRAEIEVSGIDRARKQTATGFGAEEGSEQEGEEGEEEKKAPLDVIRTSWDPRELRKAVIEIVESGTEEDKSFAREILSLKRDKQPTFTAPSKDRLTWSMAKSQPGLAIFAALGLIVGLPLVLYLLPVGLGLPLWISHLSAVLFAWALSALFVGPYAESMARRFLHNEYGSIMENVIGLLSKSKEYRDEAFWAGYLGEDDFNREQSFLGRLRYGRYLLGLETMAASVTTWFILWGTLFDLYPSIKKPAYVIAMTLGVGSLGLLAWFFSLFLWKFEKPKASRESWDEYLKKTRSGEKEASQDSTEARTGSGFGAVLDTGSLLTVPLPLEVIHSSWDPRELRRAVVGMISMGNRYSEADFAEARDLISRKRDQLKPFSDKSYQEKQERIKRRLKLQPLKKRIEIGILKFVMSLVIILGIPIGLANIFILALLTKQPWFIPVALVSGTSMSAVMLLGVIHHVSLARFLLRDHYGVIIEKVLNLLERPKEARNAAFWVGYMDENDFNDEQNYYNRLRYGKYFLGKDGVSSFVIIPFGYSMMALSTFLKPTIWNALLFCAPVFLLFHVILSLAFWKWARPKLVRESWEEYLARHKPADNAISKNSPKTGTGSGFGAAPDTGSSVEVLPPLEVIRTSWDPRELRKAVIEIVKSGTEEDKVLARDLISRKRDERKFFSTGSLWQNLRQIRQDLKSQPLKKRILFEIFRFSFLSLGYIFVPLGVLAVFSVALLNKQPWFLPVGLSVIVAGAMVVTHIVHPRRASFARLLLHRHYGWVMEHILNLLERSKDMRDEAFWAGYMGEDDFYSEQRYYSRLKYWEYFFDKDVKAGTAAGAVWFFFFLASQTFLKQTITNGLLFSVPVFFPLYALAAWGFWKWDKPKLSRESWEEYLERAELSNKTALENPIEKNNGFGVPRAVQKIRRANYVKQVNILRTDPDYLKRLKAMNRIMESHPTLRAERMAKGRDPFLYILSDPQTSGPMGFSLREFAARTIGEDPDYPVEHLIRFIEKPPVPSRADPRYIGGKGETYRPGFARRNARFAGLFALDIFVSSTETDAALNEYAARGARQLQREAEAWSEGDDVRLKARLTMGSSHPLETNDRLTLFYIMRLARAWDRFMEMRIGSVEMRHGEKERHALEAARSRWRYAMEAADEIAAHWLTEEARKKLSAPFAFEALTPEGTGFGVYTTLSADGQAFLDRVRKEGVAAIGREAILRFLLERRKSDASPFVREMLKIHKREQRELANYLGIPIASLKNKMAGQKKFTEEQLPRVVDFLLASVPSAKKEGEEDEDGVPVLTESDRAFIRDVIARDPASIDPDLLLNKLKESGRAAGLIVKAILKGQRRIQIDLAAAISMDEATLNKRLNGHIMFRDAELQGVVSFFIQPFSRKAPSVSKQEVALKGSKARSPAPRKNEDSVRLAWPEILLNGDTLKEKEHSGTLRRVFRIRVESDPAVPSFLSRVFNLEGPLTGKSFYVGLVKDERLDAKPLVLAAFNPAERTLTYFPIHFDGDSNDWHAEEREALLGMISLTLPSAPSPEVFMLNKKSRQLKYGEVYAPGRDSIHFFNLHRGFGAETSTISSGLTNSKTGKVLVVRGAQDLKEIKEAAAVRAFRFAPLGEDVRVVLIEDDTGDATLRQAKEAAAAIGKALGLKRSQIFVGSALERQPEDWLLNREIIYRGNRPLDARFRHNLVETSEAFGAFIDMLLKRDKILATAA